MGKASWKNLKLKYLVDLAGDRADSRPEDYRYIGLENIRSKMGELSNSQENVDEESIDGTSTVNLFRAGDILFGKLRPYLAKAWVCEFDGACTTEALVFRPKEGVLPRFLLRVILSEQFIRKVDETTFGSKMPRADWQSIGNIEIECPSTSEQVAISHFLDIQTKRLDVLVAEKQKLLGTLAEKRRTLITHAVTQGLDPKAPMRDSGIPWLGKIPAHWETERTKWVLPERDERSESGEEELLTVSHLTGVTRRSAKDVNMFEAESLEGYKKCEPGDLAINTLWAWMGAMGVAREPGVISPAYNVYKIVPRLDPEFVDLVVRTPRFVEEVTRFSKGVWSSRLRLYPEGLYEVSFPLPSRTEQEAIVSHIQLETRKIDNLAASTEGTIALLQERRSALISAAVTGQMEVA